MEDHRDIVAPADSVEMAIEYGNSERTQMQRALMRARALGTLLSAKRYYIVMLMPVVISGLGAFAAFSGEDYGFTMLALFLTWYTGLQLFRLRSHRHWIASRFFPPHLKDEMKIIRLEMADDGLLERQGDIISFVPWKDVRNTLIEEDLLVIELSSGLEALIPRRSPGISELELEEIQLYIDQRRPS